MLFCFTHDILRSPAAIDHVLARLRPGGRIVAVGAKAAPVWASPLRLFTRFRCRRYVTTFEGFDAPWTLLAERVPGLRVRSRMLGTAYVAWGSID